MNHYLDPSQPDAHYHRPTTVRSTSTPKDAAMTPTHRSEPMTDKLRLILARLEQRAVRLSAAISATQDGHSIPFLEGELDEVQNEIAGVRAALAAAPQPAPDRAALVEVIREANDDWIASQSKPSSRPEFIADALLARGLRLPGGDETRAWAVVGKDGLIKHVTGNSRQLAQQWAGPGDSIERVAFRRVEGGDDAA